MTNTPDDRDDERRSTAESTTDGTPPSDGEWSLAAQRPYEPEVDGGLTTTIVTAVAEVEGVPPREIMRPPLYEVVDTAALETAFFGRSATSNDDRCTIEFEYRGHRVVVRSDGWVLVYERRDP